MSNFSKLYRSILENLEQPVPPRAPSSPPSNGLSLFVWEDALSKYNESLICVLAHNEEEAWDLLRAEDGYVWSKLRGEGLYSSNKGTIISPIQVTTPKAFTCSGK